MGWVMEAAASLSETTASRQSLVLETRVVQSRHRCWFVVGLVFESLSRPALFLRSSFPNSKPTGFDLKRELSHICRASSMRILLMIAMRGRCLMAVAIAILATFTGRGQPVSSPNSPQDQGGLATPASAPDARKQRPADYLQRIRAAGLDHRTIERAMLNEQNERGLILDRGVEMGRMPPLAMGALTIAAARLLSSERKGV